LHGDVRVGERSPGCWSPNLCLSLLNFIFFPLSSFPYLILHQLSIKAKILIFSLQNIPLYRNPSLLHKILDLSIFLFSNLKKNQNRVLFFYRHLSLLFISNLSKTWIHHTLHRIRHPIPAIVTTIQCFKYQISMIYQSTKLYIGYRVIYHDMILNTGRQIRHHNEEYINHMKLFKVS